MYIRATGNISAQKTFGHVPFLEELVEHSGNRLACIEPDYKEFIDPKQIRRMSRIIRMGVAAAMECLKEANIAVPDAIITGTAYGCLEDTGIFLTKMMENNEELLTPTSFIQSTHNTIGAQIGLMLQCNKYNNAFVHRGFSFESALLDGILLLKEEEASNVLVGAIDEITNTSHTILNRMGLYRHGTLAGEGSAFFLLTKEPSGNDYAKLDGLATFYKPKSTAEVQSHIQSFLDEHSVSMDNIDLIVTGKSSELSKSVFREKEAIEYKNLVGEYPTSTAFALWMAANIARSGSVPSTLAHKGSKEKKIKKILVYNHYLNIHHSLLLVSAC